MASKRITLRLDPETDAFYRAQAGKNGVELTVYLRNLLTEGVMAKTVTEIDSMLSEAKTALAQLMQLRSQATLSVAVLRSLFETSEALKELVHARDPASWDAIKNAANELVKKEMSREK